MKEAGFDADARLDFDLAVIQFGTWVENRQNETVSVLDRTPPKNAKPTHQEPKYKTLGDLLALNADDEPVTHSASDIEEIARDVLAGAFDDDEDDE